MSPEPDNNLKTQLEDINRNLDRQDLARVVKLSKRQIWLAALLGILLPPASYFYTRRWLPLAGFFLGAMVLGIGIYASEPNEEKADAMTGNLGLLYGVVVASLDNSTAISRARERIQDWSR